MDSLQTSRLFLLLILITLTGCTDTSDLESRIAKLEESSATRNKEVDKKFLELDSDSIAKSLSDMKERWTVFQKSYSPETRKELERNLDAVSRKAKLIEEISTLSNNILDELKEMEKDALKFREQARQHADQTKDLDKIHEFKNALRRIESRVRRAESNASRAKRDASSALRRARSR